MHISEYIQLSYVTQANGNADSSHCIEYSVIKQISRTKYPDALDELVSSSAMLQ